MERMRPACMERMRPACMERMRPACMERMRPACILYLPTPFAYNIFPGPLMGPWSLIMHKYLLHLLVIAFLVLPLTAVAQDDTEDEEVSWDGFTFELENMDGDEITEEDAFTGGELYLVDFWASFCRPCSQYLPHLAEMVSDYQDRGLKVVIFCVDEAGNISVARSTLAAEDYPFDIYFDPESEVRNELGVRMIPTTVMFDPSGEELWRHVGYSSGDEEEVREKVEEFLPVDESEECEGEAEEE
jgi:cytochrome c biogenesis protein CcmG/thiol:disulfide interchange protein DsbE